MDDHHGDYYDDFYAMLQMMINADEGVKYCFPSLKYSSHQSCRTSVSYWRRAIIIFQIFIYTESYIPLYVLCVAIAVHFVLR